MPNPYSKVLRQQQYVPQYAPLPTQALTGAIGTLNNNVERNMARYDQYQGARDEMLSGLTEEARQAAQPALDQIDSEFSNLIEGGDYIHSGPAIRRLARDTREAIETPMRVSQAYRSNLEQLDEMDQTGASRRLYQSRIQQAQREALESGNYTPVNVSSYVDTDEELDSIMGDTELSEIESIGQWIGSGADTISRQNTTTTSAQEAMDKMTARAMTNPEIIRQTRDEIAGRKLANGQDPEVTQEEVKQVLQSRIASRANQMATRDISWDTRNAPSPSEGPGSGESSTDVSLSASGVPLSIMSPTEGEDSFRERVENAETPQEKAELEQLGRKIESTVLRRGEFADIDQERRNEYNARVEKLLTNDPRVTNAEGRNIAEQNSIGVALTTSLLERLGIMESDGEKKMKEILESEGFNVDRMRRLDQAIEEEYEQGRMVNMPSASVDVLADDPVARRFNNLTKSGVFSNPRGNFDRVNGDFESYLENPGGYTFSEAVQDGKSFTLVPNSGAPDGAEAVTIRAKDGVDVSSIYDQMGTFGETANLNAKYDRYLIRDGQAHGVPGSSYQARENVDGSWQILDSDGNSVNTESLIDVGRDTRSPALVSIGINKAAGRLYSIRLQDNPELRGREAEEKAVEDARELIMNRENLAGERRRLYERIVADPVEANTHGRAGQILSNL